MDISAIGDSYLNQAASALDLSTKETEGFQALLENAQKSGNYEEIAEACKMFESYFINLMFKEMKRTINVGPSAEKSQAESTFTDMYYEKLSDNLAESGGIGLAKFMFQQMTYTSRIAAANVKQVDLSELE